MLGSICGLHKFYWNGRVKSSGRLPTCSQEVKQHEVKFLTPVPPEEPSSAPVPSWTRGSHATLLQHGHGKHLLCHCHYKDISATYIYIHTSYKDAVSTTAPSPSLSPCWGCKDAELGDGSLHVHVPWAQHGGFWKAQQRNPARLSHPAGLAFWRQTWPHGPRPACEGARASLGG